MRTQPQARLESGESSPTDLAWRVIALVNLYRLLVSIGLFAVARSVTVQEILDVERPAKLAIFSTFWLLAGGALIFLRRLPVLGLRPLALAHVLVDALAMGLVLWAAGGAESGLGILVLLPIAAMAMLVGHKDALFMAASAAVAVLAQQILRGHQPGADLGGYLNAGLLGIVIFLAALLPRLLTSRLSQSEALVRRQEIDLENLAKLSQYIVSKLRESILVVDGDDRIRLINEHAAAILGSPNVLPGALLGECSPRLLYLLSGWRQHGGDHEGGTFTAADGSRLIQPHFAHLGAARPGPVLVFLEDTSLIAEKVQQSKLAALGRLSASIAHEIRTPIGAMSHASQLLAESPQVPEADRRLTHIIRDNAERVSRIVENVLELSRRSARRPQRIELPIWVGEFWAEFCATQQIGPGVLRISVSPDEGAPLPIRADPTQLHQIMWNLCQNALVHGRGTESEFVEIRYGRLPGNGRPFLEVRDHGPGIAAEDAERVFEPFFTKAARGTGLGLFLARELAESNGAALIHESPASGGTLFRLVFTDPVRWEE